MENLNVHGGVLTPANLQFALTNSGLRWEMHPAQYTSLVYRALEVSLSQVETIVAGSLNSDLHFKALPSYFLYGLPVKINKEMSEHVVSLVYNDVVIFSIDGLAVPAGFYDENFKVKA